MNFEVFTTSVELQDIPSYTTNITLEGQTLRLSFLWNERLGKRVLSVKSSTDVTYLQNTILYPNESFELNSNAVYDDLPYKVVLQKTGDVNRVGNLYNWSKEYILVFYRTVDLDVKKLNVVYGVTTPSTPILPPSNGGGDNGGGDNGGEETPTISCDGAVYYVDFAILLREGTDPSIIYTDLLFIFDGEVFDVMTPPPSWVLFGFPNPFPYDSPDGFNPLTNLRYGNSSDVNRKVEIKSLSDDVQVFAYSNPTSIQLSNDNSHVGACLSGVIPISCVDAPYRVKFYVTRIGQGSNTTFYLEYKTPDGVVITEYDLNSMGVEVSVSEDGFSTSFINYGKGGQFIVTLVQVGVKEFVLSHDYSGNATVVEEGVSYGICLRQQY